MATTVSERIKEGLSTAKVRMEGIENRFETLEQRAKESLQEVPSQLRGAWEHVLGRVRGALDYVTRQDLKAVSARVEELSQKIEQLIRAQRVRKDRPRS